jgi:hypothetical protein
MWEEEVRIQNLEGHTKPLAKLSAKHEKPWL